ncbi:unnamed protein product [Meganyctiphanes norvegica]|uniref:97 kDa heat shock protein n=1 Tax=Meganyctiphanes norvegica TaxID=48144 RepID=A0AAV2QPR5_MEGNR
MSVIGIDFGDDACIIAVARQGGIETIANDYSLRATPSVVAFGEKNRILGVAAKNQMTTNMKNTVHSFKHLIGRHHSEPKVLQERSKLPFRTIESSDGSVGIVVRYLNEEQTFTPTQLTAMIFTKLKHTAESALSIKVADVVIGVPCYYTDGERRAMLNAAETAGLNVLRLMNETTATALAYGIYKQDLPGTEEKPRNVVFVDAGHSCLQVSAAAFNKGKLIMLAATSDPQLGGRDLNVILAEYFANDFKTRYKVDAKSNPRAWLRLITEVEKLKKQMSANSTDLPINIECFMEDKDVTGKMNRAMLEERMESMLVRVEATMQQCLSDSGLKVDDIYSVEIVGGSSRVPAFKRLIEKVFKKPPSTTLNQDEAVARGCALQCAMLSPAFKVREFNIADIQPYSIRLVWQDESRQEADMEVFPKNHQVPFSKMLTFYRKEAFMLQGQYSQPAPCPDPIIGHFTINNISPTPEGESQKVKVKVRVNIHGLFSVHSANLTEKKETIEEPEKTMETDENKDKAQAGNNTTETPNDKESQPSQDGEKEMETDKPAEGTKTEPKAEGEKKVKKVLKTVDLPITEVVKALNRNQLNTLVEREAQMVAGDKLENDRINSKNAVEEYVYDLRSRLYEELEQFITESDREKLSRLLEDTENWLYEDGEDCQKGVYVDKLVELKKNGEPIKERRRGREELPAAFNSLLTSIQLARKVADQYMQGEEKFNHLDRSQVEKVEKAIGERQDWVDKNMGLVTSTPLHSNLPITAQQVYSEKGTFDALVNPIINKPKPKPKTEEPPPAPKEGEAPMEGEQQQPNGPKSSQEPSATKNTEPMDVD